jgi:hypothetical protein
MECRGGRKLRPGGVKPGGCHGSGAVLAFPAAGHAPPGAAARQAPPAASLASALQPGLRNLDRDGGGEPGEPPPYFCDTPRSVTYQTSTIFGSLFEGRVGIVGRYRTICSRG